MSTGDVWYGWQDSSTTSNTSDSIWYNWSSGTSTATATNTCSNSSSDYVVWQTWISDSTSDSSGEYVWSVWTQDELEPVVYSKPKTIYRRPLVEKTTEQKRAERVQREINALWDKVLREEMQARRAEAEDRAMDLLADLIGEKQMAIYRKTGRLLVHGKKHKWLLRKHKTIIKIEDNKAIGHCVHLKSRCKYPETDNIISLALHLKQNEEEVERIANRNAEIKKEYVEGGDSDEVDYESALKRDNLEETLKAASF